MRCADCKHFKTGTDPRHHNYGDVRLAGSGSCMRWATGYSFDASTMNPNECWTESDEGWCNVVGPDFGCVLFETSSVVPN